VNFIASLTCALDKKSRPDARAAPERANRPMHKLRYRTLLPRSDTRFTAGSIFIPTIQCLVDKRF
jgi:hypothetical protein